MNRIDATFQKLRQEGKKALMPFLTVGFPDPERFRSIARDVARVADLIEVGIPFSDPLADGPTVQRASNRVLAQGMTLTRALDEVARLRDAVDCPILVMSYVNPPFRFGFESFAQKASQAGADGVILPDLPPEEQQPFLPSLKAEGLHLIQFLTPTTPADRTEKILETVSGFVYLVTVAGTTGARKGFDSETLDFLARVRAATSLPLAAGFGISRKEHVAALSPHVDGLIVGSALLDAIDRGEDPRAFLEDLRS